MKNTATQNNACRYIVADHRKDTNRTWYVCARPGFYRKADGTMERDNPNSGPEWTLERAKALEFKSVRAAMRVRNKTVSAKVHPIL